MAGAPSVRSMNTADMDARSVLELASNKAQLVTKKSISKPSPKAAEEEKFQIPAPSLAVDSPPLSLVNYLIDSGSLSNTIVGRRTLGSDYGGKKEKG
ncbi:hypothetical protein J5N97_009956 [Dioscorea zingiberensis]|uniref:Uncharacterized protein n=1 Tax=Dioscorea zingiberensis TaxID=325984 RepID=A0A9D5CY67_9LILI|nr:hypothetical protein J5N97_009956 [Dioscorea zingiberensis]